MPGKKISHRKAPKRKSIIDPMLGRDINKNNGLPDAGWGPKTLRPLMTVLVAWNDADPMPMLVTKADWPEGRNGRRVKSGDVFLNGFDREGVERHFVGSQIIREMRQPADNTHLLFD